VRLQLGRLPPPSVQSPLPQLPGVRRYPQAGLADRLRAPQGSLRVPRAHQPAVQACRALRHFTTDLPTRWKDHLAGGYDPETHRNRGKGARLLAAALHAGCHIELVRVWYGPQARQLEQRLKQRRKPGSLRAGARRSLKPLCPLCDQHAYRHYPQLPLAPPPPSTPFRHDPQVWDADREWNLAFPELAYDVAQA
jgi:hypothetical protein